MCNELVKLETKLERAECMLYSMELSELDREVLFDVIALYGDLIRKLKAESE